MFHQVNRQKYPEVSVDLESASIEAIHFRRRLKDAGIDNCVKVYKPEPKTVAKKKKVISDAE